MRNFAIAIATAFLPGAALAHPGHGTGDGFELLHYLATPEHLLPAAAGALTMLGLAAWRRRKREGAAGHERQHRR